MKSKIILCIVLAALCLSTGLYGRAHEQPIYQQPVVEVEGVRFTIDPRIELFHTLEVLQGIPLVNFVEIEYKQHILSYFKTYKNLAIFDYLSKNPMYGGIFSTIDGPIWFLLHLTEDLEWRDDIPDFETFDPKVDSLRLLMQDFVAETKYEDFFNAQRAFYDISPIEFTL
ncbi:DUF4932 domain-containing protein [Sphingobacterium paludis]|uniref:Uncharacterized protein DUF4932 n=1 Tax=Sphingobacterium paludis TaxID=1476465 RepID=A0A4R7D496_9SPHI|nr:DUF4932 domain-containing protein [Sphingobacterium paludis]TDS14961.1 uncharacterized protein DUF4932 [Sphingobacterium paludis]